MSNMDANFTPVTRYRMSQREKGRYQVQIWMDGEMKDKIDQAMRERGDKNRSETISELLRNVMSSKGSK